MYKLSFTNEELQDLKQLHKKSKNRTQADRIKAIILYSKNWSTVQIADALLLDEDTIRNYQFRFENNGMESLLQNNYVGKPCKLTTEQLESLEQWVEKKNPMNSHEVCDFIFSTYSICYTFSAVCNLLQKMGFVYKKPQLIPGKADAKKQKKFVSYYENLKKEVDVIYFIDGVHPQHNTKASYGWFKKDQKAELKSNTGRKRLNINGAVNIDTKDVVIRMDETINAQSTIKLFESIESKHPEASEIVIISDNARYYHCQLIKDFLSKENRKINLIFLPSYSPNLNLIERLWRFFYKKTLNNRYYEKFTDFESAFRSFFSNIGRWKSQLDTLLVEKFEIIQT